MADDAWQRVMQMKDERLAMKSLRRAVEIESMSKDERKMWAAIERCDAALDKLVAEMEKLMSLKQSAVKEQSQ